METKTKQKSSLPWMTTVIVAFFVIVIWMIGGKEVVLQNNVLSKKEEQRQIPTTPIARDCLHASEVQFSTTEESRLKEIMISVMQGNADMPTLAIYNEFWSIMFSHGRLCQEDLALTRDTFALGVECSKLFYQDALVSLRRNTVYRSPEGLACEDKTRMVTNEKLMARIVNGVSVETASGNVIFTEGTIQSTIKDIGIKLDGLDRLFSSSAPLVRSNQSISASASPTLEDKSCEDTHGPSVYILNPASSGGGAWCDCKPGYVSKLIRTANGMSSWCFKN